MSRDTGNRGKNAAGDDEITELFFARDERAIAKTDEKYRGYLYSTIYNILHDRQTCEECINDVYLGVWNAIPPARPDCFRAFLTAVARRTAIKRYHHDTRQSAVPSEMTVSLEELEGIIGSDSDTEDSVDSVRLGSVISDFVRSLPERKRFIFMSRYYMSEPIADIAKQLRLSRSTVNKELASVRDELRKKLESEGFAK